jgi:hypothetical protein
MLDVPRLEYEAGRLEALAMAPDAVLAGERADRLGL